MFFEACFTKLTTGKTFNMNQNDQVHPGYSGQIYSDVSRRLVTLNDGKK